MRPAGIADTPFNARLAANAAMLRGLVSGGSPMAGRV